MLNQDRGLIEELDSLKEEHQSLDSALHHIGGTPTGFDQMRVQRIKKRKLWLKDRISYLMAQLEPDIIA